MTSRFERLFKARTEQGKYLCVGIDPDLSQIPPIDGSKSRDRRVLDFMKTIVDETAHVAGAFKPQSSYFESLKDDGPRVLNAVINHIRSVDPSIPIILDYKRGDIARSNSGYVDVAYDYHGVDAITVHPYLGKEAMQPFLAEDGHVFVLCRTSNQGAGELQDARVIPFADVETGVCYATEAEARREGVTGLLRQVADIPLYELVAHRIAESWNASGNCGLVVGATYPGEMERIRQIVGGDMVLLVPGIGTQGGNLSESVRAGQGSEWLAQVFNNSSAISFAYKKPGPDGRKYSVHEWKEAARIAAEASNAEIALLVGAG